MDPAATDVRAAARGIAVRAVQSALRRALPRVLPSLARHAAGPAAASAAAVLVVEVGAGGLSLLRGEIDRGTFRARAAGAATSAAIGVAVAAVGASAGPLVGSGLALGLAVAASGRKPPPARDPYGEALDAHLARFHGGVE